MKMQSIFSPSALKSIFLWAVILMLSFVLFSSFIIPAQAAGSGWVEARVTVPSGFKENVIVTVVNLENGEEYATRLMKENDYVSFFSLPAGSYSFDGAFLENSDFRYNVNLTNGAELFDVSGQADAPAVLLTFDITYNSAYSDGAKPTEPPVITEPLSTEAIVPVETISADSGNNKKPGSAADNQPSANTEASETYSMPTEVMPSESETVAESGDQYTSQPGSISDPSTSQQNDKDPNQQVSEKTEESLSLVKKLLYGLIGTVVFALIVFGLAYLYRRHLENS